MRHQPSHPSREILGVWAGDGAEGARFWLQEVSELTNRGLEDGGWGTKAGHCRRSCCFAGFPILSELLRAGMSRRLIKRLVPPSRCTRRRRLVR
ncbi:hypothetical protein B7R22_16770 [Subtercola boreus]|uniref:Uncharacterized protein n=1 Tax=Subtercola boreus TaxID=120213 RepID=A0A3E0VT70_9MICO|nr:hypothetical protein B7R22_16770 [Subtercola boreus]